MWGGKRGFVLESFYRQNQGSPTARLNDQAPMTNAENRKDIFIGHWSFGSPIAAPLVIKNGGLSQPISVELPLAIDFMPQNPRTHRPPS